MARVDIPMSKAMREVTLDLRITGTRVARVRMWLGCQIMRLAAFAIGCNVEISVDHD